MKTAGRENPNRCVAISSGRAHGAEGQNRTCSFTWAAKQENFQPQGRFFLLTSPFIEQIGTQHRNYQFASAFIDLQWHGLRNCYISFAMSSKLKTYMLGLFALLLFLALAWS